MKNAMFVAIALVGVLSGCRICDVPRESGADGGVVASAGRMETVSFLYMPPKFLCLRAGTNSVQEAEEWSVQREMEWKSFLSHEVDGLSWPEGSVLTMEPLELSESEVFRVTNTRDNNLRLARWWAEEFAGSRIEIDVRIVEVGDDALAAVGWGGKEALDAAIVLDELRKRSDVKTLAAPKILTRYGEEGIFKSVTEYVYPTEFEVNMAAVEPKSFAMREVGVIVGVEPTFKDSGTVDIRLNLSIVGDPEWRNYGTKAIAPNGEEHDMPMEEPQFPVFGIDSYISAVPGSTVVMSGLFGKSKECEKTILVFLTPRILNLRPYTPPSSNAANQRLK